MKIKAIESSEHNITTTKNAKKIDHILNPANIEINTVESSET